MSIAGPQSWDMPRAPLGSPRQETRRVGNPTGAEGVLLRAEASTSPPTRAGIQVLASQARKDPGSFGSAELRQ